MDTQAIKAELLNCEVALLAVDKGQRPGDGARRLTDFPCIIAGSHGVAAVDEKSFV